MSIIVADKTYLECDNCREQSTPFYDQAKAISEAIKKWWFYSPANGKTLCPKCRSTL